MSSLFEEITSCGPRDGAGGDMIAVRSILDSDRFHCFSLVSGRRNFRRCQYHRTDLTLEDIVEREEGEVLFDKLDSGLQGQKAEFQVLDVVDSKGMLIVKLSKEIIIAGTFHRSHKQRIKTLETWIPSSIWIPLRTEMRADLYLVTETLETARKETLKTEWQCMLRSWMGGRVCERTSLGPPMDAPRGRDHGVSRKTSCLLEKQIGLHIGLGFPDSDNFGLLCAGKSLSLEDFRNMKEKVQDMLRGAATESRTKSKGPRKELEQREGGTSRKGSYRTEDTFLMLFNAAGILVETHTESILNVLDALIGEEGFGSMLEQHLVAEALEKGILSLLKDQIRHPGLRARVIVEVESVLEQNWGEQPHDVGCDPDARFLCALRVAVSVLLQLGEKPILVSS
ncbi:Hypothetical predicted protein [Lynx pardinus]|uniref:Gasdermin pore forming domain-containing protein n=1 Tax=Lynx pardinus TaxID=191816 RepID=A0A485PDC0_LYNPA|nr:Hypothetical predicted protein [Lynx pardinus]